MRVLYKYIKFSLVEDFVVCFTVVFECERDMCNILPLFFWNNQ